MIPVYFQYKKVQLRGLLLFLGNTEYQISQAFLLGLWPQSIFLPRDGENSNLVQTVVTPGGYGLG